MTFLDHCDSYIRTLRNPRKRAYAWHYSRWLFQQMTTTNFSDPAPDHRDSNLSYLAAQAVRLRIGDLAAQAVRLRIGAMT